MDVANITGLSTFKASTPTLPVATGLSLTPGQTDAGLKSQDGSSKRDASQEEVKGAVADIQSFVQNVNRYLAFNVDESSGDIVVKVMDADSGQLIRQIPSEEVLRLAERLDDVRSLMFETKA
ncbi:flagellar protein FlaG [Pseudomonas mangiferae]|uniref:Flagellar protein FlaG n=1 Tax=Pseudomonas mangiferae TaxID=2593654 RepID=A0A553GY85_9PSED|nr:flagellar protein FlaG [Pseudomonas mangiferae]TRX74454.1 flagellar protein FlaG [Pseudomonas mangiferae]